MVLFQDSIFLHYGSYAGNSTDHYRLINFQLLTKSTSQKLLIIGLVWPEPESSAAGSRMMQLINIFKHQDWTIAFVSPSRERKHSEDLRALGISVDHLSPNKEETGRVIQKYAPDVVLFDRFMIEEQFGWRVAAVCPEALRILDTEDLHFLRKARQKALTHGQYYTEADLYTSTTKREIASILRCDITLLISEVEKELLCDQFKINEEQLWYLPFLIDPVEETKFLDFPKFRERRDFVFVGNFLHPPNYDAVLYLKTEIWPLIRKYDSGLKMFVYGAYPSQKVVQLENKKEGFYVRGRIDNLGQLLRNSRILLAPLRFGAGLKGKFVDAMQNGLPAVTTAIGAEGLCGDEDFGGAIAETPEEIAKAALDLYYNEIAWTQAQKNGQVILNSRFKRDSFTDDFEGKISSWRDNLDNKRRENFLGAVLMHHRQQSTKYLSRWIEAKNKLSKEG